MLEIPYLSTDSHWFPSTETALTDPNGLLAMGGDLSTERLLQAYQRGIFPWYDDTQPILWWSPSPRAVLFPDKIHISRSLRKRLKKTNYRVSCNTAFTQVITACATVPRKNQTGTWITQAMIQAYSELNSIGYAHSVEVWSDDSLVGGIYGIALGKVFFGESMFSTQTDCSKIALVYLAKQLQEWDFALIDCQVGNPHSFSLGAQTISRKEFDQLLRLNTIKLCPLNWPKQLSQFR